jgi:hypothetical protein
MLAFICAIPRGAHFSPVQQIEATGTTQYW